VGRLATGGANGLDELVTLEVGVGVTEEMSSTPDSPALQDDGVVGDRPSCSTSGRRTCGRSVNLWPSPRPTSVPSKISSKFLGATARYRTDSSDGLVDKTAGQGTERHHVDAIVETHSPLLVGGSTSTTSGRTSASRCWLSSVTTRSGGSAGAASHSSA